MSGSQNGNGGNGKAPPPGGEGSGVGGSAGSIFSHAPPEGHAKKTSEVLGEACPGPRSGVVWLMSQSGTFCCAIAPLLSTLHKQMFIQGLEWPAAQAAS